MSELQNRKKQVRRKKPSRQRKQEAQAFHPRVIVKFHDYIELPYEDGIDDAFEELRIGPWNKLVEEFPNITFRRLLTVMKPNEIVELVDRATELDREYKPPNLLTYFVVECPSNVDPKALAEALLLWPSVQTAYLDQPALDPIVNPANDPRWPNQGYLDAADDGIAVNFVWPLAGGLGIPGADGAGQRVIDLEQGWTLNHEDLATHNASVLFGTVVNSSRAHGTAVLGELCAVDNTKGCIGIAPNVASVNVVSHSGSFSNIPNAIFTAIKNLEFGNVLLLEVQTLNYLPCETDIACFDAIRLATALGRVVVEAAGNGATDLDTYLDSNGKQVLNRASSDFKDSFAIMVGASDAPAPHPRRAASNYGSRIDCFAWGRNVETCYSNSTGATNLYTTNFLNTSAASPIIAGAALVVQGITEANLGYRFNPKQIRAILSNPNTGTDSNNPATDRIGVMPDLQAINLNLLNTIPDIYIRDFVGDIGDPHTGAISASPDIILRPTAVANPQASFGQGSGTENSNTQGYEAKAGQNNYIYVRVLNRSSVPATNVNVTVFWSPVSTLLTPDLWTKIPLTSPGASLTIPNIPASNVLTVSNAITWPSTEIPGDGHYCFVGLVGNEEDPAPNPTEFFDWNNYRKFIRENNNVTWRNFNVVSNTPNPDAGDPSGFVALPFLAPGAPDKARLMGLEVVARLPKGSRAFLEVPLYMMDAFNELSPYVKMEEKLGKAWLPVNPFGRKMLGEALFPAKSRTKLRLLLHIPEELRENEYEVYICQIYEKEEVGRVTWRLVPPDRKERLNEKL